MMTESYTHLRQFTPQVLEAVDFSGGTGAASLLEAVKILKGLIVKKARKVPDQAPDDFVPARWRGYPADAVAAGDPVAYRHFWELTVLLGLRDGLRSGDVWEADITRLSPFVRHHVNTLGRSCFHLRDLPGGLRPLREPGADELR